MRSGRRYFAMLGLVGAAGMLFGQTAETNRADCESNRSVDAQIVACTDFIRAATDPSSVPPKIYRSRSEAYAQKGQFDLAIADMDSFIRLDGSAEGYSLQGGLFLAKGDYARAMANIDTLQKMEPTNWRPSALRGLANLMAGRYAAAEPDLAKAVAANPTEERFVLLLYVAQSRNGEDGRATLVKNAAKITSSRWPAPLVACLPKGRRRLRC